MNLDPKTPNPIHIEEAGLNAWPALQTNLFDGWIVRFANGYTKRANSVNLLYSGTMPLHEKIAHCEAIYARHNQPVIFRLPSFHPDSAALDAALAERGYHLLDETSVQVANIEWSLFGENERVQDMLYPGDWLQTYHRLDQAHNDNETHEQMLKNIVGEAAYLILRDDTLKSVACGLGISQGAYVGLYDIVVGAEHRRKGYGAQLVEALIRWGVERHHARYAYLSVVADNSPAVALYARYGFEELYRYHYRILEP